MRKVIIGIVIVILVILGIYYFVRSSKSVTVINEPTATSTVDTIATSTPVSKTETVIGKSVEGRDITAYHFGTGAEEILVVGGIHGAYAWNTTLLAYQTMDYLKANLSVIPANLKVTVIPLLNPDGLNLVAGTTSLSSLSAVSMAKLNTVPGRYNGNEVDLNRNFDCQWQAEGKWQNKTVSGGTAAFSEPESLAIKNYVEAQKPKAVIALFSSAGGVYSSSCTDSISTETKALTNAYAKASGYPAYMEFSSYETTGDFTNWLAKINIPAVSVLLTNHTDTDFTKNKAGLNAILKYYAE